MNCEQALQAMSARLDGELPEDEARALDAHLRECAPCRALMAELTELDDGLKTLSVEPPETLAPGVMRAIRAETAKKQKKAHAAHHDVADRGRGRTGARAWRGGRDRAAGLR